MPDMRIGDQLMTDTICMFGLTIIRLITFEALTPSHGRTCVLSDLDIDINYNCLLSSLLSLVFFLCRVDPRRTEQRGKDFPQA
jgi:hypothetical protein